MKIEIRQKNDTDGAWVDGIVRGWGADFIVTRGRMVYPARLPALAALDGAGRRLGLLSYEIVGDQCEIILFEVTEPHGGIGTELLNEVVEKARSAGCGRLWLITSNDNLDALRFYQRRGFVLAALHANAMENSRRLKPSIPPAGSYGIPLRDVLELELPLR